eukprot:CAMPEP_0118720584 /NCGR_PEP_ID=MMETSP0800-20121206/30192_1 /TAXON_ID=210618 ORGANISM="Striatella unipunctata, Strain CCMP2910" /NCGR_SAMPLE_ID=MMETSP0800 /ASSEMBLY_ACC=CAM_ASM_000638 /LENGTH=313 /DNA_ID=CAMNT_0006628241 /DNA_START=97 /DNA_END=1035 /DNA_ORIENTATION=-
MTTKERMEYKMILPNATEVQQPFSHVGFHLQHDEVEMPNHSFRGSNDYHYRHHGHSRDEMSFEPELFHEEAFDNGDNDNHHHHDEYHSKGMIPRHDDKEGRFGRKGERGYMRSSPKGGRFGPSQETEDKFGGLRKGKNGKVKGRPKGKNSKFGTSPKRKEGNFGKHDHFEPEYHHEIGQDETKGKLGLKGGNGSDRPQWGKDGTFGRPGMKGKFGKKGKFGPPHHPEDFRHFENEKESEEPKDIEDTNEKIEGSYSNDPQKEETEIEEDVDMLEEKDSVEDREPLLYMKELSLPMDKAIEETVEIEKTVVRLE